VVLTSGKRHCTNTKALTRTSKIAPMGLDLHCYAAPALYVGVSAQGEVAP